MEDITLNFGALKESVNRKGAAEIHRTENSETLREFATKLKKSSALQKQYFIYKNIENCKPFTKERLAERFIAQNLNIVRGMNWREIVAENKAVKTSMLEGFHIESNKSEKNKLFESIDVLIESETNSVFTNVERGQNAYEYILEYITREVNEGEQSKETADNPSLTNWKTITKLAVNNFNKRYDHLNEEEKKVFKIMISEASKKRNYIEDLRVKTLSKVTIAINECKNDEKLKLLEQFKNKLETSTDVDTIKLDEHLLSFMELQQTLNEE